MKLTPILRGPPVFHFWKDFGAGKKRRIPYYKQWWNIWRFNIMKKKMIDHTLPASMLPPGSRLMEAEDFMRGHIGAMPDELIELKEEKIVYDHPWPFNATLDPIKKQEFMHCYDINTRFFVPRDDSSVLTNTILETDSLLARPPFEPTEDHISAAQRQFDWSTRGDSVLIQLPRARQYPKINIKPKTVFGASKERQEVNVLLSLNDFTQTILAQYHHQQGDQDKLDELSRRRAISFPHCQVPFERDDRKLNMKLCIDLLSISNSPLPQIDMEPQLTKERQVPDIKPRSWRSLVEQSKIYTPSWSFTLPREAHLHTIQLASRIIRSYRDSDEMLARCMTHAFGLAAQYARLKFYEQHLANGVSGESKQSSVILEEPLKVIGLHEREILERPIVVQVIGLELPMGNFHFLRYQLNSAKFDDSNEARVKNQAWYSGKVTDLSEVLRYYLDFQAFDTSIAAKMLAAPKENDELLEEVSNKS